MAGEANSLRWPWSSGVALVKWCEALSHHQPQHASTTRNTLPQETLSRCLLLCVSCCVVVAKASVLEQVERQMEELRSTADAIGWKPTVIKSVEDLAAFDPLTACPDGSALVMHLKETDGSADHAVAIARGFIFDANRPHALPLTTASLEVLKYEGIVSATLLTPSPKIAKALERKRAAA